MNTLCRWARIHAKVLLLLLSTILSPKIHATNYLVVWGDNRFGQLPAPFGLTNVVGLGGGTADSQVDSVINGDGTLTVWGCCTNRSIVPAGLTNVIAVTQGYTQNLGLKSDGSIVAWGANPYGEGAVPAGISNVIAIAAGSFHDVVLKSNGTVAAWGYGDTRISVPNGLNGVIAVGASYYNSLALKSNGTLVAWGSYSTGTYPPTNLSNVVAISGAFLALKNDGTVAAWGDNSVGQTNVPPGLSNVIAIAGNTGHNLALKSDHTIVGWGDNQFSESSVPPGLTNVLAIAVSGATSLAIASVNDGSPIITSHPTGQTAYSGTNVSLVAYAAGVPSPTYQWQLNGTDLPGATNAMLSLNNVQTADSGNYTVTARNVQGTATSLAALLVVSNSPPTYPFPPQNQTVIAGSTVTVALPFAPVGSLPLKYQWYFNSGVVPGATNVSYIITNVQLANQGNYSLFVSNAYGYSTTSNGFFTVIDLGTALDNTSLAWTTSGSALWQPVYVPTHGNVYGYVARSGPITNSQSSALQSTVTGPGKLSFWWQVSSQPTLDYVSFSVNGVEQTRISGTSASWTSQSYNFPAGTQTLLWTYVKGTNGSGGQDTAWLDSVTFTPGPVGPSIGTGLTSQSIPAGSNITLSVTALGTPVLNYQWQHNGAIVSGATNSILVINNAQPTDSGAYQVIVSNAYGAVTNSGQLNVFTYVGAAQPQEALDRWFFRDPTVLNRVRFVGGVFIGVGPNGVLMTSTNGSNWIRRTTGTTANLTGAAFSPNVYVVVGSGGTVLTSFDTVTWTSIGAGLPDLNDVAGSIDGFVASTTQSFAAAPNAAYSFGGFNWYGVSFSNAWEGTYYSSAVGTDGQERFITAGGTEFAYDIWQSVDDGFDWSNPAFSDQVVTGIAYGNGKFVMVGWEGWPRISADGGSTWSVSASTVISSNAYQPPNYDLPMVGSDITFGNGIFLVARGSQENGFLTTPDGLNWTARGPFAGNIIQSVAYGNGTFVAINTGTGLPPNTSVYPVGIYQSMPVAAPIVRLTSTNSSGVTVNMSGESGRAYRLQSSADLVTWQDRLSFTNTGALTQFSDPMTGSRLFYRVVSP